VLTAQGLYKYMYVVYIYMMHFHVQDDALSQGIMHMGWLRLVGSLKVQVSFAKETDKRDDILQKRPMILRSLLIVATHRQATYT